MSPSSRRRLKRSRYNLYSSDDDEFNENVRAAPPKRLKIKLRRLSDSSSTSSRPWRIEKASRRLKKYSVSSDDDLPPFRRRRRRPKVSETVVVHDTDSDDEVPYQFSRPRHQPTPSPPKARATNDCTQHSRCFDHICKICKVGEILSACRPCGHFCICQTCYERMPRVECPICRRRIKKFTQIFFWVLNNAKMYDSDCEK